MPIYLIAAYAIFVGGTLALACSIWARQRRLEREIAAIKSQLEAKEG
jgi:AmiR/NasT family two-component response regulator